MKLLYEASNSIEAHMIVHLLEQAGLSARIDGELLQGGVGELQPIGIVRVMIAEADYQQGKQIIDEWDARQKVTVSNVKPPKKGGFGAGLVGFALGIVVMIVFSYASISTDGIDYDGDGRLDEKWTYKGDLISKTEVDRNRDGIVDEVTYYDRQGWAESTKVDANLDGSFETETYYDYGLPVWHKSDTNGDGFNDLVYRFKNGNLDTITFFNPVSKKPIKIQRYGPFTLESAEVDTDGDGILDTIYEYNAIEEVTREYKK